MFRNIPKIAIGTMGMFGAAYIMAKQEQKNYEAFQKKYPGEEPIIKTYPIGSIGWHTTYERKEENPQPASPSPK